MMGDYSKALSYQQKALAIREQTLPPKHPHLASSYDNIGLTYYHMSDYLKALSYCEHAISIGQCSLPSNHPELRRLQRNLELVKSNCK
jgi:tetratricopeptide (TPR) repeat protein